MTLRFASSLLILALGTTQGMAQSQTPPDNTKANALPDNSTNKTTTADGQPNSTMDLKITQQIRRSIMADKSLSTYAHNIKIVSVNGMVTLNGVVKSVQERSVIESKAQAAVGNGKVSDALTVAPTN